MLRGLYVHIPFCRTRCHYCHFVTTAELSPVLRERFFIALKHEIHEARRRYGSLCFDTLYLGGGTPSCLSIAEMTDLWETVHAHFKVKEGSEVTCEWNPGDGDEEKLAALAALGINRISLGAQSFQDSILKRLGRRYLVKDIFSSVEKIRTAGISNISLDLMLRVPGQKFEDFHHSLETCLALQASQVSLYDLEVHPQTVFGKLQGQGRLHLPGEEEHAGMYQDAIKVLTGAGYEHYEISNFSKAGFASRHNLIYWRNQEYLGLGPGAFSYLNGMRYQFAEGLDRYLQKCEGAVWRNDQQDVLSDAEKETETLMTGLRLREGIALSEFPKISGSILKRVKELCDEELLEEKTGKVRFTDRGKFLSESVFGFLLQKDGIS
ncbi:MAG TPA: radical SAM family heme chaperone HemW [Candidatus Omnitrophota bacterium]|nr:radical SAM family heme chaperone HemW [Candidatus Omnitrophota bacterium]